MTKKLTIPRWQLWLVAFTGMLSGVPIGWAVPAHASVTCAPLYTPETKAQWKPCIHANNAFCRQLNAGILGGIGGGGGHVTCTFPDGGRDECDWTGVLWTDTMNTGSCVHVEPGG